MSDQPTLTSPQKTHNGAGDPPSPASVGLIEKLANIALDFQPVPKRGQNDAQGYSYVKAEDIIEAASKALLAEGIHVDFQPIMVTFEDRSSLIATVQAQLILTDVQTGEQMVRKAIGSGADKPGDKATAKAMTMARKYALIHVLDIPIGDDPDESRGTRREQVAAGPKLDPERVAKITAIFHERQLPYKDIELILGSAGLDTLRARSQKAIRERLESLTEEQADALEKELGE